ncbi:MAG: sialate O-acetylesterase [Bryobacterales bacterium]
MRKLVLPLALLLIGCGAAPPEPEPKAEMPLWLFVLAGQSNMAGRGVVEVIDSTPHPRVFALKSDGGWGPATEPLHWDKPDIIGVGPGFAFGRAMAERNPDVRIGLIPTAVGGSSIRAWVPGGLHEQTQSHPWDDAIKRIQQVRETTGGELKGIIWHQGESDSKDYHDEYPAAIADLIARFRSELGAPNLPFVAGQMGAFYVDKHPGSEIVNAAIADLPNQIPHTAYVSAEDTVHKGDEVHFDSASARTMGERYAAAMEGLIKQ